MKGQFVWNDTKQCICFFNEASGEMTPIVEDENLQFPNLRAHALNALNAVLMLLTN